MGGWWGVVVRGFMGMASNQVLVITVIIQILQMNLILAIYRYCLGKTEK